MTCICSLGDPHIWEYSRAERLDLHSGCGCQDVLVIDESFNLQKLVNRAIFLYNTDDDFRDKVNEVDDLKISGSSF